MLIHNTIKQLKAYAVNPSAYLIQLTDEGYKLSFTFSSKSYNQKNQVINPDLFCHVTTSRDKVKIYKTLKALTNDIKAINLCHSYDTPPDYIYDIFGVPGVSIL